MDKIKHISLVIILFVVALIIFLIVSSHSSQQLGGGYWYDKEGKRVFGPEIDIPPVSMIVQCKRDYIIVEQHPNKDAEEATYERVYHYPYGRDSIYYWVICKKDRTFFGPLIRSQLDSVWQEKSMSRSSE